MILDLMFACPLISLCCQGLFTGPPYDNCVRNEVHMRIEDSGCWMNDLCESNCVLVLITRLFDIVQPQPDQTKRETK